MNRETLISAADNSKLVLPQQREPKVMTLVDQRSATGYICPEQYCALWCTIRILKGSESVTLAII